ncbi:Atxe2 family lasso peptide isopeptidase [Brevundimonas abyssalis]|uniref:Atxe2 family lasso peptide isopeptidase n=1 Tax=Brevundimonas abyssalis TaxID=1125965 RepID=UPI00130E9DC2|nr:Atxe2 family lasso peptide isopeptidase [Brevundimonas abyssalis]
MGEQAKTIEALDLARLRDFGEYARPQAAQPFSLSPDGKRIALLLRRADPESNSNCLGVVIVPTSGDTPPILADFHREGGAKAFGREYSERIRARHPGGLALSIVPKWSPDGKGLAFLKRLDGVTRIWRVDADGRHAGPLTPEGVDVEDFAWNSDGGSISYSTAHRALVAARLAREEEGLGGFHYDDRFMPFRSNRPLIADALPADFFSVDLATGAVGTTTGDHGLTHYFADERDAETSHRNARGDDVRVVLSDPDVWFSAPRLTVQMADGAKLSCDALACSDVVNAWWSSSGNEVIFLRQEGWGNSQLGMYRWQLGADEAIRAFATDDLLFGCQAQARYLICAHEASTQPRRIVRLDPNTGVMTPIYDPNPEVGRWRFGTVERLEWKSELGTETFGDLVLPPDHRPGERYPLIISTYSSKGFLRGGTGDEYPVQAFASRGYAVLSFNRPRTVGFTPSARTSVDVNRNALTGWSDRKNVHSALEEGIRLLVSRGIVDESRIGVTGLSEGSAIALWATFYSDLIAATAISSCCTSEVGNMALQGPLYARQFRGHGYPGLLERDTEFWKQIAPEHHVGRLTTPVLMQLADDEFYLAASTIAAAQEAESPVDLFVFPDEGHIKWQPAHRLAVYQRNLDWFDFWLKGAQHCGASRAAEYDRWRQWREDQSVEVIPTCEPADQPRAQTSASVSDMIRR